MSCAILDLETLCGPGSPGVILQIACITLDEHGEETDHLNVFPCVTAQLAAGLLIDHTTLDWWQRDDRADARAALKPTPASLCPRACAEMLLDLFARHAVRRVWMRGPDFDATILRHFCATLGVADPIPFPRVQCRDLRTASECLGVRALERNHNALDDCRAEIPIVRAYQDVEWQKKERYRAAEAEAEQAQTVCLPDPGTVACGITAPSYRPEIGVRP
jgi:hypothetical protein